MTNEHQRRQAIRAMRGKMRSPGRPSTARREDRVRFWEAIGRGLSSEDAAAEAGVASAVGTRWFREAGGMPPLTLAPVSGRYLVTADALHAQRDHAEFLVGDKAADYIFGVKANQPKLLESIQQIDRDPTSTHPPRPLTLPVTVGPGPPVDDQVNSLVIGRFSGLVKVGRQSTVRDRARR